MTIKHDMKLSEIEAKITEVQRKRRQVMNQYKAGEMTMRDLKGRLKGLNLSLKELEKQQKKWGILNAKLTGKISSKLSVI